MARGRVVDDIRQVCVVGAGTMGSQIAQQFALYEYAVVLIDNDPAQLARALATNRTYLQRRVDKGRLDATSMNAAIDRVRATTDLTGGVGEADFVIEAVAERLEIKQELFQALDELSPPHVVLASNSSTITISRIATGTRHPERCLNMHFFHPAMVMQLVEVMQGDRTSREAVHLAMELAHRIGKQTVHVQREIYGLLVNRILGAIKREAFWLADQGYASPEDIDKAMRLGLNHPMGPFELSDFSGLDVFYNATLQQYRDTNDEQYKPARILEEKVRAGHLGRKTGQGFYRYEDLSEAKPGR